MKLLDFHEQALKSEDDCVNFLNSFGIFDESAAVGPGKSTTSCNLLMKRTQKKNKKGDIIPSWRCSKKTCRTQRSICSSNRFFMFEDTHGRNNCKLSLRDILLIIYFFVYSNDTNEQLMTKLGHGKHTIVDWLNLCREGCSKIIRSQPKMIGTN